MNAINQLKRPFDIPDWQEEKWRRQILQNAALAHRILQPYAQEELLRIFAVRSEKQLIALVESLRGSRRLEEHAKKTEVIKISSSTEHLLLGLFQMCCNAKTLTTSRNKLKLSTIGKLPAPNLTSQDADMEIFPARLTRLRYLDTDHCRIYIDRPTAPFARIVRLEFCETRFVDEHANECDRDLLRSLFSPAQFPALRQISIDDVALEGDPLRFSRLHPQLSDIEFNCVPLSLVGIQLPHCTSLKVLHFLVMSDEEPTELVPFFTSLRGLSLEEFRYLDYRKEYYPGEWKSSLRDIQNIMAIVAEMETLKTLSLAIAGINKDDYDSEENYYRRECGIIDEDYVGGRSVRCMKWVEFGKGIVEMCWKNKVKIVRFDERPEIEQDDLYHLDGFYRPYEY
jgi:hypothetical protein